MPRNWGWPVEEAFVLGLGVVDLTFGPGATDEGSGGDAVVKASGPMMARCFSASSEDI